MGGGWGGGVANPEQRSRSRSRRGGVSKNWTEGATAARLFFLTAVAIAIATRPFKYHENSVTNTTSSFVFSIHSFAYRYSLTSHRRFTLLNKNSFVPYIFVVMRNLTERWLAQSGRWVTKSGR